MFTALLKMSINLLYMGFAFWEVRGVLANVVHGAMRGADVAWTPSVGMVRAE